MSFDPEQFVDEGMEAAGIVQDDQDREYPSEGSQDGQIPEEYPVDDQHLAVKPEPDNSEPEKSYLTEPDSEAETEDNTTEKHATQVPVSALQKERHRRRELEAELERLRHTPPEGENSVVDDDPLKDLADDDYPTAGEIRKVLSRNRQLSPDEIAEQVQQRMAAQQQQSQSQQLLQKAQQLETEYSKANPDYDAVMDAAGTFNLITNDDRKAAIATANPAEYLHKTAKSKLEKLQQVFGQNSTVSQNQNQQPHAPTGNIDEDIFNEVFGGGQT